MKRFVIAPRPPHFAAALLAGLACAALLGAASAQTPAPAPPAALAPAPLTGPARADAIAKASAALNRVNNLQGRFAQVAPDGARSSGVVYLSRGQGNRVGRLRFEYDAPAQFLVVADGVNVATIDKSLRTTTRVGIGETPLFYLLKPNINLERDARIVDVSQGGGQVFITLRDRGNKVEGTLRLALDANSFALRAWEITDAARNTTRLSLIDARPAPSLSPRLFVIEDLSAPRRR
jgi:outer membrane lipoprotein-sorting protein